SMLAATAVAAAWASWRVWLRFGGRDDVPLALGHRDAVDRILRTARYVVRAAVDGTIPLRWSPDYAPEGPASVWWLVPAACFVAAVVGLSKHRRFRPLAA